MRQIYLGNTLINDAFLGSDRMSDVLLGDVIIPPIIYDNDAQNFFTATGIASTGLRGAVNEFVVELKDNNLWNNMLQILPFVADDTASLAIPFGVNLRNTGSFNPQFRLGSVILTGSLLNSDLNGYQSAPGTFPQFINTNLIPDILGGITSSMHVGIYTTSPANTTDEYDYGYFNSNLRKTIMIIGRNASGSNSEKVLQLHANSDLFATTTDDTGYYVGQYNLALANRNTIYLNGNVIAENNIAPGGTGVKGNGPAFLGALNDNNTPNFATTKKYQLLTVGSGLTANQVTTLNTIVHTFQQNIDTALGTSRAV
jgi:hypothetical protein